jgi:ABC-type Mn2+/Zn2+ transport system ATPase subunit
MSPCFLLYFDILKPLIEFKDVTLGYGRRIVLENINFKILSGDFFGVVGPNGSGKTTLLKAILGILKPLKGKIFTTQIRPKEDKDLIPASGEAQGTETPKSRSGFLSSIFFPQPSIPISLGYVPQHSELDPIFPLSVLDIVLMGRFKKLGPWKKPGKLDREISLQSLEHVGIVDLASKPFQELSGGQKQRTLIARALATEPQILVLDEPTSGMDLSSEKSMMELIQALHEQDGLNIIMASHNLNLVANYAEKITLLHQGIVTGRTDEILSEEILSKVYQIKVSVREVDGTKVILTK